MSIFTVKGTVTAIGQSVFDNNITIYAYLQITEDSDRRVMIEKIAVCNDTSVVLCLGLRGEFSSIASSRFQHTFDAAMGNQSK